MAMTTRPTFIGIDISKDTITVSDGSDSAIQTILNTRPALRAWLRTLPAGPVSIGLEATNTYHLELTELADRAGHKIFLLDGYRLARYRDSVGVRAKTDNTDARLLQRYLTREHDELRAWTPPPAGYSLLRRLQRRRTVLVQARVALRQSFAGLPEFKRTWQSLQRQLDRVERLMQKRLQTLLVEYGWAQQASRCQAIEGIGPLTATALTTTFQRGSFRSADAFIAFLGLDVCAKDSGRFRGRRRLSKKGDPELRRLLYMAAMQAARTPAWQPFYQRHLARGLSKIQAYVALARKLARVAFSLLKHQTEYVPKITKNACMET